MHVVGEGLVVRPRGLAHRSRDDRRARAVVCFLEAAAVRAARVRGPNPRRSESVARVGLWCVWLKVRCVLPRVRSAAQTGAASLPCAKIRLVGAAAERSVRERRRRRASASATRKRIVMYLHAWPAQ